MPQQRASKSECPEEKEKNMDEEDIRELLELLKKNAMKEQANDVFERTRLKKCRKIRLSIIL